MTHARGSFQFHPSKPILAVTGERRTSSEDTGDQIHIFELDLAVLLGKPQTVRSSHYVNAKVLLLGDTGVGKSGLAARGVSGRR